jgi:hypothetical protein
MAFKSKAFAKAALKSKYNWSGEKYSDLCSKIVKENRIKIANVIANEDERTYRKKLSQIKQETQGKGKDRTFKVPSSKKIVQQSNTIIKAAEQGRLMTKKVRQSLQANIKKTIMKHGISDMNGNVPTAILEDAKIAVTKVFSTYTKGKGKELPSNINTIATTETRSAVNTIRFEYTKKVNQSMKQDGYEIRKQWVHNDIAQVPRQSHIKLARSAPIGIDDHFKWTDKGKTFTAKHPHDSILPASQTINCNCENKFVVVKIYNKKAKA